MGGLLHLVQRGGAWAGWCKIFLRYIDIAIFALEHFILPHPVGHFGDVCRPSSVCCPPVVISRKLCKINP